LILKQALVRGHAVRALPRQHVPGTEASQQLSWVMGDADDVDSLKTLIDGCDAVISAIGRVQIIHRPVVRRPQT
jgi:putative NADH-flavin reductase